MAYSINNEVMNLRTSHDNLPLKLMIDVITYDALMLSLVAALYTPLGDVEEIFNPLGVSSGASES